MRFNSEGVRRADLIHYLQNERAVRDAVRIDQCLLCRRGGVMEAGLCELCYGLLEGEELRVAVSWRSVGGP